MSKIQATERDLAWAAGLFEGEGCITIGIRKSDETYRLIATVGGYFNNLGRLRSLGLIDYPTPGRVGALPVLFLEASGV